MALIPWRNLFDLDRFFEDEDWFLPVLSKTKIFGPEVDLYETDKDLVAEVNLPGFDPEKIEVRVEDDVLYLRGEVEEKKEEKERSYWRKEIRRRSFERAISLPVSVKEDQVTAEYEKGVLKVIMPKAEGKEKGKKVTIKIK